MRQITRNPFCSTFAIIILILFILAITVNSPSIDEDFQDSYKTGDLEPFVDDGKDKFKLFFLLKVFERETLIQVVASYN